MVFVITMRHCTYAFQICIIETREWSEFDIMQTRFYFVKHVLSLSSEKGHSRNHILELDIYSLPLSLMHKYPCNTVTARLNKLSTNAFLMQCSRLPNRYISGASATRQVRSMSIYGRIKYNIIMGVMENLCKMHLCTRTCCYFLLSCKIHNKINKCAFIWPLKYPITHGIPVA